MKMARAAGVEEALLEDWCGASAATATLRRRGEDGAIAAHICRAPPLCRAVLT